MDLTWVIWASGGISVLFAIYLASDVLRRDQGTPAMQRIAGMIYQGAVAFLWRQYRTIAVLAVIVGVIIGIGLDWQTAGAFAVGATCSAASGIIGMFVAVKANLRTASAAQRSLGEAITVALRGGAVSGFLVVALSLLGVAGIFYAFGGGDASTVEKAPFLIVGFGFGASFVALFAQLGGGIYTKAADVGADLVGKVEAGIPEDDPRNPAVIADLVGDNVGDCAGRGADLFESTAAENIGAMILGVAIYAYAKSQGLPGAEAWILFPLVLRAFGLIACIVGIMFVGGSERANPMSWLNRGYWVSAILCAGFSYFVVDQMLKGPSNGHQIWFFYAAVVGIATSIVFVYITQYYTSGGWRPVQEIAKASRTGPATNIISGIAVGFETTASTAITIGAALLLSHWLGEQSGLPNGGLFGTAVATMGMLMTCAFILAMDTFGPITDNAGGITEMSHAQEGAREITDALDAVGNTTKALTKGYAIASAALAAFLLFSAYIDRINELAVERQLKNVQGILFDLTNNRFLTTVDLADVRVFVAALLGAMLVYLFSSLAIRAVGRAASDIIEEVRRQFRDNPGIMEGKTDPDFGKCVDLTAKAALREMVVPGLLAVGMPIVVGVLLRAEATAGFLMIGTIAGVLLATVLNNGGGAWDNAKKFIESGGMKNEKGETVGKRTPTHAAAVVGDTVGDPFKDTAGPSLHVLVKLLATITLVLAPLFI